MLIFVCESPQTVDRRHCVETHVIGDLLSLAQHLKINGFRWAFFRIQNYGKMKFGFEKSSSVGEGGGGNRARHLVK